MAWFYTNNLQGLYQNIFQSAGITINGNSPSDIKIHDSRFYNRVLSQGSLGLGESYMDGWWDCECLDEFFFKIYRSGVDRNVPKLKLIWHSLKAVFFNLQSRGRAFIVGKKHYDLSNQLFQLMLDKRMVYSCGYWKNANTLDEAQEAKLELTCQKLYLKPGMEILDIGCGWGSFSKYAAEKYGVKITGITVSEKQLQLAKQLCQGLPIDFKLQDYRDVDLNIKYDRIVSIGQMEHVGYKNYYHYMKHFSQCLNEDGLFLLSTSGSNASHCNGDPWIEKYIFPNGQLPSGKQLSEASEEFFVMEDWHNFGVDYDKTLMAWYENFNKNWDKLKEEFDDRFYRQWKFYLLACAGAFRARHIQNWQIVYSPHGVLGGYKSVR